MKSLVSSCGCRRALGCVMLAVAVLGIGTPARADLIVIPAAYAAAEGPGGDDTTPLGVDGQVRAQVVYGSALLGALGIGDQITGLTFRVGGGSAGLAAQTVTTYEIRLSQSQNAPGSLSTTFASNRGADEVIVRSGQLTINAGDFPGGATPNAFGAIIPFSTPYTFAGGPLLLEIAYTGFLRGTLADDPNVSGLQSLFGSTFGSTTGSLENNDGFLVQLQVQRVPEPASLPCFAAAAVAWDERRRTASSVSGYEAGVTGRSLSIGPATLHGPRTSSTRSRPPPASPSAPAAAGPGHRPRRGGRPASAPPSAEPCAHRSRWSSPT